MTTDRPHFRKAGKEYLYEPLAYTVTHLFTYVWNLSEIVSSDCDVCSQVEHSKEIDNIVALTLNYLV